MKTIFKEFIKEKASFTPDVKYYIGDLVYDKTNKDYGVVLNNYDDPINGSHGEIRLDSNGNQGIFKYTKDNHTRIGYNLVKQDLSDRSKKLGQICTC